MNRDHSFEIELTARLDLLDNATLLDGSRLASTDEVVDLLSLAHQIRTLPPVEPDTRWMEASKRRMLARFEAAHGRGRGPLDSTPTRRG